MTSILWVLFYVAVFYLMFRYGGCCGGHGSRHRHGGHDSAGGTRSKEDHRSGAVMSAGTDPVCGMAVSEDDGYARRYEGRTYHFCSKACLDRFEAAPDHYAGEERLAS